MKEIPLSKGQVALVDDEDYLELSQWKWHADWCVRMKAFYATRRIYWNGKLTSTRMHRQICGLSPGDKQVVDHRDHDTLNNCRFNLRVCTQANNMWNSGARKSNTSGQKGVSWSKDKNCWRAEIRAGDKRIFLGWFRVLEDAGNVYREAVARLHGEFAFRGVVK